MKFRENRKFEEFKRTLRDSRLITLTPGQPPGIRDENAFLELGFGLYLLWIHATQPQPRLPLYFTSLDSNTTLFLVSPHDNRSHFSLPPNHTPGTFYLDSMKSLHSTNPSNCNFCHLRNSFFLNLSHFRGTQSFGKLLTQVRLVEIQKAFNKKMPDKCESCADSYYSWLKSKIIENEQYAVMLGGNPAVLQINSKVFSLLFTEPIELNRLGKDTIEYMDFFLTIYLANFLKAKQYAADTKVAKPFVSHEIDCIILIGNSPDHNLLVLETTSYHHDLKRIRSKCLTYSALKTCVNKKYLYVYLTLAPDLLVRYSNGTPGNIIHDDDHYGTFHPIIYNSPDLQTITLSSQHKDLAAYLKQDWWDPKYLRASFGYYIDQLCDKTKGLRVK